MAVFCDKKKLLKLKEKRIIVDTNILASCFSNEQYLLDFRNTFKDCKLFIDPIVKLEFLRGTFKSKLYEEKLKFLELDIFWPLVDNYEIYKNVYSNSFDVAKAYCYKGKKNLPLGDLFIIARLMEFKGCYLITLDNDFNSIVFDRYTVVSIEKKNTYGEIADHISILLFNKDRYLGYLAKLS